MAQTEVKVTSASVGALGASLVVALLNSSVGNSELLGDMPGWLQFVLLAVAPTLITYFSGYAMPSKTSVVSEGYRPPVA